MWEAVGAILAVVLPVATLLLKRYFATKTPKEVLDEKHEENKAELAGALASGDGDDVAAVFARNELLRPLPKEQGSDGVRGEGADKEE